MKQVGVLVMLAAFAVPAGAGELFFANGSRLEGELANEMLVISTGRDLVEVAPETVALLSPVEIRLKDGRVLRGTLVGGSVKARTALGELAVRTDELRLFRADGTAPDPSPAPAPVVSPVAPSAAPPVPTAAPPTTAVDKGPLSATVSQQAPTVVSSTSGAAILSAPAPGPRLEVVTEESVLYRDALASAPPLGRVLPGQWVTYLDSIDRRLHIFNVLIFDGGHWIKVRVPDGTEGWVPATTVREVR